MLSSCGGVSGVLKFGIFGSLDCARLGSGDAERGGVGKLVTGEGNRLLSRATKLLFSNNNSANLCGVFCRVQYSLCTLDINVHIQATVVLHN